MNLLTLGTLQGVGPTGQLPAQSAPLNAQWSLVCFHSPAAHLQRGNFFKSDLQLRWQSIQGRQRVYSRFHIHQSRLRAHLVSLSASFSASMSARARGGDDGMQLGLGDPDGVVASCSEHWKPVLELHLVRGSSSSSLLESTAAAVAAATDAAADAAADPVYAEARSQMMVEEMMCLLRAVTRFQSELGSGKWRHEMPADEMMQLSRTVGLLRSQLGAALRRQELTSQSAARSNRKRVTESGQEQQEPERVVACVRTWPYMRTYISDYYSSDDDSDDKSSEVNCEVWKVDLSFVPNDFWSQSTSNTVLAAAHGLVCVSNDSENYHHDARGKRRKQGTLDPEEEEEECEWGPGRPWSNRYCLLNPLTRTCTVLPEPPFSVARWLLPTSTSVAVVAQSDPDEVPQTVRSATYDWQSSAAGGSGGWVLVPELVLPYDARRYRDWPPDVALLDGRAYWYTRLDNRVHVTAAAGACGGYGAAAQVLDGPSVALLGLRLDQAFTASFVWFHGMYARSALVAHRGAIYFVAELLQWFHTRGAVCGVFRLGRSRSGGDGPWEWERVARLDKWELDRLTGFRRPDHVELGEAYGARELLCCRLQEYNYQRRLTEARLLGYNLDKHRWEVVYGKQQLAKGPMAFELRPDLFLPSRTPVDVHSNPLLA